MMLVYDCWGSQNGRVHRCREIQNLKFQNESFKTFSNTPQNFQNFQEILGPSKIQTDCCNTLERTGAPWSYIPHRHILLIVINIMVQGSGLAIEILTRVVRTTCSVELGRFASVTVRTHPSADCLQLCGDHLLHMWVQMPYVVLQLSPILILVS